MLTEEERHQGGFRSFFPTKTERTTDRTGLRWESKDKGFCFRQVKFEVFMRSRWRRQLQYGSQIWAGHTTSWVTRTQIVFMSVLQDFVHVPYCPHLTANSMRAGSVSSLLLPPPPPSFCPKPKFSTNQPKLISLASSPCWLLRESWGLVHSTKGKLVVLITWGQNTGFPWPFRLSGPMELKFQLYSWPTMNPWATNFTSLTLFLHL